MGSEFSCCDRMKDEEFNNEFKYKLKIHRLNSQIDELQYKIDNKNEEITRLNKKVNQLENRNNADIEITGSKTMVL